MHSALLLHYFLQGTMKQEGAFIYNIPAVSALLVYND